MEAAGTVLGVGGFFVSRAVRTIRSIRFIRSIRISSRGNSDGPRAGFRDHG